MIVADSRTGSPAVMSCVFAEAIDQALRVKGFSPHPLVDRQVTDRALIATTLARQRKMQ